MVRGQGSNGDVHGRTIRGALLRRFTGLADRFTHLAIRDPIRAPLRRAARSPLRGRHPEVLLERPRERPRRLEASVEGHREHVVSAPREQGAAGPLEPHALHELGEVLARGRLEHPMEVERRERGHLREGLEAQILGAMLLHVVDDPVDPILVLDGVPICRGHGRGRYRSGGAIALEAATHHIR